MPCFVTNCEPGTSGVSIDTLTVVVSVLELACRRSLIQAFDLGRIYLGTTTTLYEVGNTSVGPRHVSPLFILATMCQAPRPCKL